MSLHFELVLACDLKPDTPPDVLDALGCRESPAAASTSDTTVSPTSGDDTTDEWRYLLRYSHSLWWFPGIAQTDAALVYRFGTKPTYTVSLRIDALDDDFYELWLSFVAWLAQYSSTEGFIGYCREEMAEQPTLLYFRAGKVYAYDVPAAITLEPWFGGGF